MNTSVVAGPVKESEVSDMIVHVNEDGSDRVGEDTPPSNTPTIGMVKSCTED
jgi:hypothetical protein